MQTERPPRVNARLIRDGSGEYKRVTRVSAFSPARQSCFGYEMRAELIPAKSIPAKRVAYSDRQIAWECHPLPLKPRWMAKGYTRFNATAFIAKVKCDHGRPDGQRWGPRLIHVTDAR